MKHPALNTSILYAGDYCFVEDHEGNKAICVFVSQEKGFALYAGNPIGFIVNFERVSIRDGFVYHKNGQLLSLNDLHPEEFYEN